MLFTVILVAQTQPARFGKRIGPMLAANPKVLNRMPYR